MWTTTKSEGAILCKNSAHYQQHYHQNGDQAARRSHILCSIGVHSFGALAESINQSVKQSRKTRDAQASLWVARQMPPL